MREEIRQDKDWVIRLRTLPDAPETYYLMELMASHDFQTALQNYLDLEDLRARLVVVADELRRVRGHDPRCAASTTSRCCQRSTRSSATLDAQMRLRLEQREHLDERLQPC